MRLTSAEKRARAEARDTARASGVRLDEYVARLVREAGWRGVVEMARAIKAQDERARRAA